MKAGLDILCSNLLNLKNEIMKIKQKKYFVAHKNFEKYFIAHQHMPKIFHESHKNHPTLPPPLHVWSLKFFRELINERSELILYTFWGGFSKQFLNNNKFHGYFWANCIQRFSLLVRPRLLKYWEVLQESRRQLIFL